MLTVARRVRYSRLLLLLSVTALVGCDHVTKIAAKAELGHGGVRPVVADLFQLQYAENRDVAFNLLRWVPEGILGPMLLVTGAAAIALLAIWVFRARGLGLIQRVGATLVLAGALGNTLDRVVRGYVVDFMVLPHWPIFNVADVYVCAGVALLLLGRTRSAATAPDGPGTGPAP